MIVLNEIKEFANLIFKYRRDLHKIPEIGYCEYKTSAYILDVLSGFKAFEVSRCGDTGVKAVFRVIGANKTIAFRSDMDALEVTEQNDVDFKSTHENMMHACGHDGHMAMLLGLAAYIDKYKDKLKHNIVLIFQPAEESYGGAQSMIENGALDNPIVDVMYGFHLMPSIEIGKIGIRKGALMAQASEFDVIFKGKSAHGAMPELGNDALCAACQFVTSSQGIVSRSVSPYEQCVLTYGAIKGGTLRNVICDNCVINGTMRSFSNEVYENVKGKIIAAAEGAAQMYGCSAEYIEKTVYPFVDNPAKKTEDIIDLLLDAVQTVDPMMIAEDFSFYQRKVHAVFMFLGCLDKDMPRKLHSETFNFDETALLYGVQAYINILKMHDDK